jgi:hypothetical protein
MLQAAGGFGGSFSIAVVRAQVRASAFNFTSEIVVRFSLRIHVKRICQRSAESRGFPSTGMLSYLPKIRQRCSEAAIQPITKGQSTNSPSRGKMCRQNVTLI